MRAEQKSPNRPRVKPIRLVLLFLIVNAGIVVTVFTAFLFATAMPTLRAFDWHIHNGNTFVIEGHTFHVPIRWNCTLEHYKEWELSEDHPISGGSSDVSLSSTGQVVDAAAINRLISFRMKSSQLNNLFTLSAETIHGRRLTFVCTHMDERQFGERLSCNVPNTDISVSTSASSRYIAQVRAILETSD